MINRTAGRTNNNTREITFEINYNKHVMGSCLVKVGETWVLCNASIENKVPHFIRNTGKGWVTAEYSMLPCSTNERMVRDVVKGKQSGRSYEIQRLISRSLKAAVNLDLLGERQIIIDCDVLQADGGTRTAAINGGYVALHIALQNYCQKGFLKKLPIEKQIAAISCGIIDNKVLVDMDYNEDSNAEVDGNFVYASDGNFVEVQCTGEQSTVQQEKLIEMLEMAKASCLDIMEKQKKAIERAFSGE